MKYLLRLFAVLAIFSLVAAACGDDDETSTGDDAAAEDGGDDAAAEDGGDDAAAEDGGDDAAAEDGGDDAAAEDGGDDAAAEDGGDDAAAEDGGGDAAAEGLARAQAAVDAVADIPTDIGPTIPLESTPPTDVTVAWLECEVTCAAFLPGFEEATELLGWNLETISVQSFDPAPGFQQALDLGADYIAITGTPPALVQEQIDAAAAAGVGIYSCYEVTVPDPEVNNIFHQCGDATNVFAVGELLSNRIIVESGGTAHTLMVNIPDFPVLVAEAEGARAAYEENCPGCTFTELNLTLDQLLAGEAPGAVLSALQSDPTIDYIHYAFDGIAGGMTVTLSDAGALEQVTQVGVDLNTAILQEIIDGTQAFWTVNPVQYAAFLMVDGMARHSVGMENTEERDNAFLPTFFVDDAATAEALLPTDDWPGPENMGQQFAELWGVG